MNDRLRERRRACGMSQADLAGLIGVSRQTVNMIESGDYNPTLALCLRLCRALGCTLNDLFWDDATAVPNANNTIREENE